jgi:hypothetical protein
VQRQAPTRNVTPRSICLGSETSWWPPVAVRWSRPASRHFWHAGVAGCAWLRIPTACSIGAGGLCLSMWSGRGEMADQSACGDCGKKLEHQLTATDASDAPRVPCPYCGSLRRHHTVTIAETTESRTSLGLKLRRAGQKSKRPAFESKAGADLHRASGTWSEVLRVIDRESDTYLEHIVRADGIVLSNEEPLSKHRGHGSAKKQP